MFLVSEFFSPHDVHLGNTRVLLVKVAQVSLDFVTLLIATWGFRKLCKVRQVLQKKSSTHRGLVRTPP